MHQRRFNMASNHRKGRNGFSLTETVILVALCCIIGVFALQIFISQRQNSTQAGLSLLAEELLSAPGETIEMIDEQVALGAPVTEQESSQLRLSFGKGSNAISISVPGSYKSKEIQNGSYSQRVTVSYFMPE